MQSSIRRFAVTAATLAALTLPAPPVASAAGFCYFNFQDTDSPGFTMTPTPGTFTSGGQTGKIICGGDLDGKAITGPGTIGIAGQDAGSCVSGSGSADWTITLPTADGPRTLSYPVTFSWGPGFGSFSSSRFSGAFGFLPTKGDCLTAPVTAFFVYGSAWLTA